MLIDRYACLFFDLETYIQHRMTHESFSTYFQWGPSPIFVKKGTYRVQRGSNTVIYKIDMLKSDPI